MCHGQLWPMPLRQRSFTTTNGHFYGRRRHSAMLSTRPLFVRQQHCLNHPRLQECVGSMRECIVADLNGHKAASNFLAAGRVHAHPSSLVWSFSRTKQLASTSHRGCLATASYLLQRLVCPEVPRDSTLTRSRCELCQCLLEMAKVQYALLTTTDTNVQE